MMEIKQTKRGRIFMAFGKGKESGNGNNVKRYIGVGSVKVMAVNPNKAELERLYGTTLEKDPVYIGEVERGEDKHKVKQIRLDLIVKACAEDNNGVEMTSKVSIFLTKEFNTNRDNTKVQVINKYGQTTWVPWNGTTMGAVPANIKNFSTNGMRPCYIGEEDLTNFIRATLNIVDYAQYKNNEWIPIPDPSEAECQLDTITQIIDGNVKELKDAFSVYPDNKVKVLFGVRTTNDNKQYQDVFLRKFVKNGATNLTFLEEAVSNAKQNGAYPNTEFVVAPLAEYVPQASVPQAGEQSVPQGWFSQQA